MAYNIIPKPVRSEEVHVLITGDFVDVDWISKVNVFTKVDWDEKWNSQDDCPTIWRAVQIIKNLAENDRFYLKFKPDGTRSPIQQAMIDHEIIDELIPNDRQGRMCRNVRVEWVHYYDVNGDEFTLEFV